MDIESLQKENEQLKERLEDALDYVDKVVSDYCKINTQCYNLELQIVGKNCDIKLMQAKVNSDEMTINALIEQRNALGQFLKKKEENK